MDLRWLLPESFDCWRNIVNGIWAKREEEIWDRMDSEKDWESFDISEDVTEERRDEWRSFN